MFTHLKNSFGGLQSKPIWQPTQKEPDEFIADNEISCINKTQAMWTNGVDFALIINSLVFSKRLFKNDIMIILILSTIRFQNNTKSRSKTMSFLKCKQIFKA